MQTKRNTEGLVEYAKKRTDDSTNKVKKALNQMIRDSEKITIAAVAKRAGVSPNFIYSNEHVLKTVRKYCDASKKKKLQSQDAKDVIIATLKNENRELKSQLKTQELNNKYKERCIELEAKVAELQASLDKALSESLSQMILY
ncbi:MAG: hypothetical protein IJH71_08135 [Eubacterium sp.]|nr:hypothetical protein [Eubacterium sp.]